MQSTRLSLAALAVLTSFAAIGVCRPAFADGLPGFADVAAYFKETPAAESDNQVQLASCNSCASEASSCGNDINGCVSSASRHLCDDCQTNCTPACAAPRPQSCCAPPCVEEYAPYCDEMPDVFAIFAPRSDFRSCTPSCDRWYISVSGGWQQRDTVHEVGDPETFVEFDDGFLINGALGVHINDWRVEVETSFMNNGVSMAGAGGLSSEAAGNVSLHAYMFNLYRDFHCSRCCWLNPYIGAGIGVYQSELNGLNPEFFDQLGAPFAGNPINATSNLPMAYQFRAGVSCPLTDRAEIFSGYRYFKGQELEFASAPFASFAPTFHPDGAVINAVEVGVRVNF